MDLNVYINFIFLCAVNIIFTFSGIVSNTLVIACFWKSSQLRKKLCHFMIMVLSYSDLVAVITNHPGILLYLVSWSMEDYGLFGKMTIYLHFANIFLTFSFYLLLVMCVERYLGTYYPIFHCTSVTRRRLLALFPILIIPPAVMYIISIVSNGLVVPRAMSFLVFKGSYLPPFVFINFKLLVIVRKVMREREASPGKRTINLKNISTALWAVACLFLLTIPSCFYIAFDFAEKSTNTLILSSTWALTIYTMNCTFNSLIFFWKNKVLRAEGTKILKTLKDRLVGSPART